MWLEIHSSLISRKEMFFFCCCFFDLYCLYNNFLSAEGLFIPLAWDMWKVRVYVTFAYVNCIYMKTLHIWDTILYFVWKHHFKWVNVEWLGLYIKVFSFSEFINILYIKLNFWSLMGQKKNFELIQIKNFRAIGVAKKKLKKILDTMTSPRWKLY